jgi:LytS/YehU family sensor histidine kinase
LLPAWNARARTHLLANTLSLIASLLRRRPRAAEDLLSHLGRYLHESVSSTRPLVPLASEVDSALSFLGLERARLGGRLRVDVTCAADALAAAVPSVIVQPLVENAVRHGVALRREGGVVRIRARIGRGHLQLVVSDDGVGWRRGAQSAHRDGWGIVGVRLRLAALCGSRARLRVWSRPDRGTIAAITIPVAHGGSPLGVVRSRPTSRPQRPAPERWH